MVWLAGSLSNHLSCTKTLLFCLLGRTPQLLPIPLSEKYRTIAIGCPIILQCEVSDPTAQVSWFKDGGELYCKTGLDMKRDGNMRKLIIQSAKLSDSGIYICSLINDVVTFLVDVKGDFLRQQYLVLYSFLT